MAARWRQLPRLTTTRTPHAGPRPRSYQWDVWMSNFKPGSQMAKVGRGLEVAGGGGRVGGVVAGAQAACVPLPAACRRSPQQPPHRPPLPAPPLPPPPQDMDAVSRRHSTTTLQLRFTFMRGLHPFYPPRVEVVRPHLAHPLLGALCSHPMLRLANWDPWVPMQEVVGTLKAFLEDHGSVVG
jgi:hypothetical protein